MGTLFPIYFEIGYNVPFNHILSSNGPFIIQSFIWPCRFTNSYKLCFRIQISPRKFDGYFRSAQVSASYIDQIHNQHESKQQLAAKEETKNLIARAEIIILLLQHFLKLQILFLILRALTPSKISEVLSEIPRQ